MHISIKIVVNDVHTEHAAARDVDLIVPTSTDVQAAAEAVSKLAGLSTKSAVTEVLDHVYADEEVGEAEEGEL